MKRLEIEGSVHLYYAYGFVMVFDKSEPTPQARWIQQHENQGFARRERSVMFSTLRQEGKATVNAFEGWPVDLGQGSRIIAVPLKVLSGELSIQGPEEWPEARYVKVAPGVNTVILSQRIDEVTDQLVLDFFIDAIATENSKILKAGGLHNIPSVLLETAEPV